MGIGIGIDILYVSTTTGFIQKNIEEAVRNLALQFPDDIRLNSPLCYTA